MSRLGWLLSLLVLCLVPIHTNASELVALGFTNAPIGQAELSGGDYSVSVDNLDSNGLNGISVRLGESESGGYFTPGVSSLYDGYFMQARAYGRLNGANDQWLSRIQGGRAAETLYPVEVDLSPLGPEFVTFEISNDSGEPSRIFAASNSIMQIQWGSYPNPVVNPLTRLPDGSLGMLIEFSYPVTVVFPTLLASHTGDRVFIRAHNPTNTVEFVSRVDLTGGGGLYGFALNEVQLGMFGHPHRAFGNAIFNAAGGRLELQNLHGPTNTQSGQALPGVNVNFRRAASAAIDFFPFGMSESNAVVLLNGAGTVGGEPFNTFGSLALRNNGERIDVGYEQGLSQTQIVEIRSGGAVVQRLPLTPTEFVTVPANILIGQLAVQAKTADAPLGVLVRFAAPVAITRGTNAATVQGDEIRFLVPDVIRFEELNSLQLFVNALDSIIITNETVRPVAGPPAVSIAKTDSDMVLLSWLDPNRLYVVEGTVFPWNYFTQVTNLPTYTEPLARMYLPIISTNDLQLFRLRYQPPPYPSSD